MNLLFVLLGTLGPTEIVLILIALLLMFGGKKIPELMKGLGTGIREFKKASNGDYDHKEEEEKKGQIENK
jgi:sec-independent protein translocase protein TatA